MKYRYVRTVMMPMSMSIMRGAKFSLCLVRGCSTTKIAPPKHFCDQISMHENVIKGKSIFMHWKRFKTRIVHISKTMQHSNHAQN